MPPCTRFRARSRPALNGRLSDELWGCVELCLSSELIRQSVSSLWDPVNEGEDHARKFATFS